MLNRKIFKILKEHMEPMSSKKASRRSFLGYAATAIVVGVVAGVGGYYAGLLGAAPVEVTSTTTVTTTQTQPGGMATTTVTPPPVTRTVTQEPVTVTSTITTTPKPGPSEELIEAAKNEGKLVFYTPMRADQIEALFEAFKAKYPFIETEYYRATTPEIYSRIESERRAGKDAVDVINQGSVGFPPFPKAGWIEKYVSPESAVYPPMMKHPESYGTALRIHSQTLVYNTDLVSPDELKTMDDLLNPKFKGKKIGMMDARLAGPTSTFFLALDELWGTEKLTEYFGKLKEQDIRWVQGAMGLHDLTSAGETWIGLAFPYVADPMKDKGAPIDWVRTNEIPLVTIPFPTVLTVHAPHPNAGKLFIDWGLSEEGQKAVTDAGMVPARPGLEPDWLKKYNAQDLIYIPQYSWQEEPVEAVKALADKVLF